MKIQFPRDKKWSVSHAGEWYGHITWTFGANLYEYPGEVTTSLKLFPHTFTADFGTIQAMWCGILTNADGGSKYWAVCEKLYKTDAFPTPMVADTLTSTPTTTTRSDAVVHGENAAGYDILVVSTDTNLARFNYSISATTWDVDWWTATTVNGGLNQPALTTSVPHVLITFGNAPILFITDKNKVHSVGTPSSPTEADVSNSRLVFAGNYTLKWAQKTNSKIYFGLSNDEGDHLPGLVEEYDPFTETVREFVIEEGGTTGWVHDNVLEIIDNKGNLRAFTGSGFRTFESFPTAYNIGQTVNLPHRNGARVIDGVLHLNMPSTAYFYPGGVWKYDYKQKQLYHSQSAVISKTDLTTYGVPYVADGGALMPVAGRLFLAGMSIAATANTTVAGVFYTSRATGVSVATDSRCIFETAKIPSTELDSVFRNVGIMYNPRPRNQGAVTGKIVVKYRKINRPYATDNLIYTATWATTTTFTTPTAIADTLTVGDEIFIWRGVGAGMTAHITAKSAPSGGNVTITIDETVTGAAGTLYASSSNWKRIPTDQDISSTSETFKLLDLEEGPSSWVQFKVEIRNFMSVEGLQVGAESNLKVEKE